MGKRKIIWSNKALNKLFGILEFYELRNKSKAYSIKLYRQFNYEISKLSKHPKIGIKTNIDNVRGLIIENYIIFYEYNEEMIFVLTIWDCRQNPDKLDITPYP
jgi:plasmid stabilization system protein ParE